MEMAVRGRAIVYICLECGNEWAERRVSSIVNDETANIGDAAHRAVEAICSARDLEPLMAATRMWARQLTGADGVTFVLRSGDSCYYADEDAIEPLWKGQRFPLTSCVSGWVMLNRQSIIIPDIYADPRVLHEAYRPTFVKSMLMVPVRKTDGSRPSARIEAQRTFRRRSTSTWWNCSRRRRPVSLAGGQLWARLREGLVTSAAQRDR